MPLSVSQRFNPGGPEPVSSVGGGDLGGLTSINNGLFESRQGNGIRGF